MKSWDTNFLLRHLLEDNTAQLAIVRKQLLAAEKNGGTIFLPILVLVETAWHLRGLMGRKDVLDTLEDILADTRFLCESSKSVKGAIQNARIKVDYSDHLIAATAKHSGASPVQTFDQALKNFPGFEIFQSK